MKIITEKCVENTRKKEVKLNVLSNRNYLSIPIARKGSESWVFYYYQQIAPYC